MLTLISRPRTAVGSFLAAVSIAAALVLPGSAQAAPCPHADTVFSYPTRFASEPIETYSNRVQVLRNNVRTAIVCLTNKQRTARGLRALTQSTNLRNAAEKHAVDLVRNRITGHIGSDGRDHTARAVAEGYCSGRFARVWENVAYEYPRPTARSVVTSWMNSPRHRANILDPEPKEIGVGLAFGTHQSSTGGVFVQKFGRCV